MIWGNLVDGPRWRCRSDPDRAVQAVVLTAAVVAEGRVAKKALERIRGLWAHQVLPRRKYLSLLE